MTLRSAPEASRYPACGYQRTRRPVPGTSIQHPAVPDWCHSPFLDDSAIREMHQCMLPASAHSCRTARRFAGKTLDAWGVPQLADDLFLVVSELVANAVRHGVGLPDDGALTQGEPPAPVRPAGLCGAAMPAGISPIQMTLLRGDRHLVCAVIDPNDAPPVVTEVEQTREGGRGLRLVEAFSKLWGWTPIRSGGKVVWAAFPVPAPLPQHGH